MESSNRLLSEQFNIIINNNLASALGSIVVASLLAILIFDTVDSVHLLLWYSIFMSLSLYRLIKVKQLKKRYENAEFFPSIEIKRFFWLIMLIGLAWGSISPLFLLDYDLSQQLIISIIIAGVSASSSSVMSPIKSIAFSFTALLIIPLVISFLLMDSADSHIFALLFIVYLVFLFMTIKNANKDVQAILDLNYKNLKLIEDLKRQKAIAEKNNKVKNQFLANMSHEVRTPMNSIMGFSELLRQNETKPEKLQFIRSIHKSSQYLLQIISDILDFSKLENNQISFEKKPFSVEFEIKTELDHFKDLAKEQNLQLDLEFDSNLPNTLYSDVSRIKQVMNHLISNAIKFSFSGSIISVKTGYDHQKSQLIISVQDYGIGIPKNQQATIFNAFTQVDLSETRKYGGTGLGLSISSKIVEGLGGLISLDSEENKGSRFTVSIPAPVSNEVVNNDRSIQQLKGHILIVEDDKTNQLLLKRVLEKIGLSYEIAADGNQAVAAFTKRNYDLILMDENMPHKTGIEATQEIRQLEVQLNRPHQVIIALTANALKGDKERFIEAGMDEYLSKPINILYLNQTLSQYLEPA